jgi:hypothetical protein
MSITEEENFVETRLLAVALNQVDGGKGIKPSQFISKLA